MKKTLLIFTALLLISGIVYAQDNLIKVKVGILDKSGSKATSLKLRDRVKNGDEISVYVQPMQKSYVYVLCVDQKEVTLLNANKNYLLEKDKLLVLPSESEYYQTDNMSAKMDIVVICDKTPVKEIENLFKGKQAVAPGQWASIEKKLSGGKSKIKDASGKPITIAGNVRGVNANFLSQLPAFSSEGKMIRKYEIEIKK